MRILSPQRLPFRHPGMLSVTRILASLCSLRLAAGPVYPGLSSKFDYLTDWFR